MIHAARDTGHMYSGDTGRVEVSGTMRGSRCVSAPLCFKPRMLKPQMSRGESCLW